MAKSSKTLKDFNYVERPIRKLEVFTSFMPATSELARILDEHMNTTNHDRDDGPSAEIQLYRERIISDRKTPFGWIVPSVVRKSGFTGRIILDDEGHNGRDIFNNGVYDRVIGHPSYLGSWMLTIAEIEQEEDLFLTTTVMETEGLEPENELSQLFYEGVVRSLDYRLNLTDMRELVTAVRQSRSNA